MKKYETLQSIDADIGIIVVDVDKYIVGYDPTSNSPSHGGKLITPQRLLTMRNTDT